jgi:hypothetical protein
MAAIRCAFIATEASEKKRVFVPSPELFGQMLRDQHGVFYQEIRKLIPSDGDAVSNNIAKLFKILIEVLKFKGDYDNGIPKVLLPALGLRLYEILIFWLFYNARNDVLRATEIAEKSRAELLRFVMFWLVFIENADRGADCALQYLIMQKCECFPGKAIYAEVVRGDWRGQNARSLLDKNEFASGMAAKPKAILRTRDERFDEKSESGPLVNHFWWSREKLLPWIQRRYLHTEFAGFDPTLGYENEVPFDYDHICSQKEVSGWSVDKKDRDCIRDSIGNFWILHGSLNRKLGDCDVQRKLSGSDLGLEDQESFYQAREEAFGELLPIWLELDATIDKWPDSRGAAFQDVVEKRTVWLYGRFFDELYFHDWLKRDM